MNLSLPWAQPVCTHHCNETPAMLHPGQKDTTTWKITSYSLHSSQFAPSPSSGAKPRTGEHLQLLWLSPHLPLVHVRTMLTLSSIASHKTTNSGDSGTALVLGCSHRTVIPAVALRAFSRWGKVMDEFPSCGLQAWLWMLQEINTSACPGWVGGGTARLRFQLWILQGL